VLLDESLQIIFENGIDEDEAVLLQVGDAGQPADEVLFGGNASGLLQPLS
jgi:hypothetical protein